MQTTNVILTLYTLQIKQQYDTSLPLMDLQAQGLPQ